MHEVIIIGAGPAGCAAAIALALRGREVLLLERQEGERAKLCAGGLPPKVIGVLPVALPGLIQRSVDRIRFTFDGDKPFELSFSRPLVHMVQRAELDRRLTEAARRAGAFLKTGVRVIEIQPASQQATVLTTLGDFQARAVIAADGATGTGARLLGGAGMRMCPAVQADLEGSDAEQASWEHRLACDFGVLPGGIAWVFPKAHVLSVGVCSFRPPADLRVAFERWTARLGLPRPPPGLLRAHPLPTWDGRRSFRRGCVLVAGDAAGLVNPLTGAGIRRAAISGQLAAESVHAFLAGGGRDPGDLAGYDRRLNTHLVQELSRARLLANVFYRAPGIFHRLGVMNSRINPFVEELLSGRKSYLEVFRELITGWALKTRKSTGSSYRVT